MRTTQYSLQLAIALALLSWVSVAQAQRGPGGGCQRGSVGTPTMGTPTIGTPTTTTGIVPVYPYYGGSSTAQNYYQQSQLAYQMAMQMEYLRQQQEAYAKQLEDQAAAAETARLHKVSLRQQRRQELEARRAAAKERRLAQARDRQRRATTNTDHSAIGQLAANER